MNKIAIINHNFGTSKYRMTWNIELECAGYKVVYQKSLESLIEKLGDLTDIHGFMLHIDKNEWTSTLKYLKENHPNAKRAHMIFDMKIIRGEYKAKEDGEYFFDSMDAMEDVISYFKGEDIGL